MTGEESDEVVEQHSNGVLEQQSNNLPSWDDRLQMGKS